MLLLSQQSPATLLMLGAIFAGPAGLIAGLLIARREPDSSGASA